MVRRRNFLALLAAGAAGPSGATATGRRGPVPARNRQARTLDEHDTDDWLVHYTVDVERDGRARITTTLEGSEIPSWVRFRKQRVKDLQIHSGETALTHGDYSIKWDTATTESIEYSVQLGHLRLVRTEMAVLEDSVTFRDRELAPVGNWAGGMDALPREHRITIRPPDGWSALSPGRQVDANTYDVYPSTRIQNTIRDLFAVGDFTVQTKTTDGSEIRVAELPSADGPPVEDVLSLLADTQPIIEEYFGEETSYPKAGLVVPSEIHPSGGFARDNSFLVSDTKPLYDVAIGESTYVHEFAHTWQRYGNPDWQVEGPLTWLQMLALYDTGEISEAELMHMLRVWSTEGRNEVGDPIEVPANDSRHRKGAAVCAALDVDIRARTDGAEDIGSFVSRVNDQRFDPEYTIGRDEELAALREVTGVDYAKFFERFVDGPDYPEAVLSEEFSVEAPSTVWGSGIQLSGVGVSRREVRLDESVTVTADVANVGDVSGRSTVRLFVDDEEVASKTVTLEPEETTTVEFDHSFEESGERTLRVDDRPVGTVTVVEHRPEFEVVETVLSHGTIGVGERMVVTARIENTGRGDGVLDVELTVDGEVLETISIWVPADGSETVTFSHQFETDGEFGVAVDGVHAGTVSVRPETTTATGLNETTENSPGVGIPGFDVLGAVAGLGGATHLLARRLDEETD